MNEPSISIEEIQKEIESVAFSRLASLSCRSDIGLEVTGGTRAVFAPWMALILITGSKIRISLKFHFKSRVARSLAAPLFRKSVDQISVEQGIDFVRELSNLIAGGLKKTLGEAGFATGISLPIVTRGFDEAFFVGVQGVGETRFWTVRVGESEMLLSSLVEINDLAAQLNAPASPGRKAGS